MSRMGPVHAVLDRRVDLLNQTRLTRVENVDSRVDRDRFHRGKLTVRNGSRQREIRQTTDGF